jgi:hypothetical protein
MKTPTREFLIELHCALHDAATGDEERATNAMLQLLMLLYPEWVYMKLLRERSALDEATNTRQAE